MTSAQTMLDRIPRASCCATGRSRCWIIALFMLLMAGCTGQPRLEQPMFLHAPYAEPQLWAVAPFANESGVSDIDTFSIADAFVEQLQDVEGILTIPVNRVIRAMRELDIDAVQTAGEARTLMNMLDVDGLIVGVISAYDPYRPPKIAAAIELHHQPRHERHTMLDTRTLSRSPAGNVSPGELGLANPVAQAAGVFDAANHRTLAQLREFTRGRHQPDSAFGQDIYLIRMDLYAQFASFRLIHDLLAFERARLTPEKSANLAHVHER